jgi:hypothetical protein
MNTEQRKQYMKTVVYPKMKDEFAGSTPSGTAR